MPLFGKGTVEAAKAVSEGGGMMSKLAPWLSGAATPLALDYRMNSDKDAVPVVSTVKDMFQGKLGKDRAFNLGFNALIGAMGGHQMGKGNMAEGMGLLALAPAKDLLLNAQELPSQTSGLIKNMETNNKLNRASIAVSALGGLGLLGFGSYALPKILKKLNRPEQGRIKIKMPGKKGDPETTAEVELPINMPKFSPTLTEGLDKAVRLRTRKNIRANSYKKDPETGKLIPYDDWEEKYGRNGEYIQSKTVPYDKAVEKAAADRSWTEGAGSVGTALGTGTIGALIGATLAGGSSPGMYAGSAALTGGALGGLLGLVGPNLLGTAIGKAVGKRTVEEQKQHDANQGVLDLVVPGYAAYNTARRNEDAKATAIEHTSREAVGDEEFNDDNDTMDDWEEKEASFWSNVVNRFYKEASMPPQSGATPDGTPPQQPAANPGGANVQANPNNPPAQQGSTTTANANNAQNASNAANKLTAAMDRIDFAQKSYRVDPATSTLPQPTATA